MQSKENKVTVLLRVLTYC